MINLNHKRYDIIILALIFLLIFFMRLYYVCEPVLNIDEGIYLYIVQDMIDGGVPYKDAFDHKGPVLFFLLFPVVYLFGNSIEPFRIFTTLCLLFTMWIIYLAARRTFKNRMALAPPLIYGLFFNIKAFEGLSGNGEIFMMLPVALSFYFFIKSMDQEKSAGMNLFLTGVFSACAVMIKATAVFSVFFLPVAYLFFGLSLKKEIITAKIKALIFYTAGIFSVLGILFIYFLSTKSLNDFIFSYFTVNALYSNDITAKEGFLNLLYFMFDALKSDPVTISGFLSLAIILFLKSKNNEIKIFKILMILLAVFSITGVYWGKTMYAHYYLQMGLSFAFLAPLSLEMIIYFINEKKIKINKFSFNIKTDLIIPPIIFVSIFLILVINLKNIIPQCSIAKNSEIYKVSSYIKSKTGKNDKIFILGGEPMIYYFTHRRAPTRYFCWIHHSSRFIPIIYKDHYDPFPLGLPKYIIYEIGYDDIKLLVPLINSDYRLETRIGNSAIFAKK